MKTSRINHLIVAIFVTVMLVGGAFSADVDPNSALIGGADSGVYSVNDDSFKPWTYSHYITSVPAENRGDILDAIRALLPEGSLVQTACQKLDGKDVIILAVTATQEIQEGVGLLVEKLNRGDFQFSAGVKTVIYHPKYQSGRVLAEFTELNQVSTGFVYYDETTNTVIIINNAVDIVWIVEDMKALDVPSPQCLFKATLVYTYAGFEKDFGPCWSAWKNALPSNVVTGLFSGRNAMGNMQVNSLEMAFTFYPRAAAEFIKYLESEGMAESVSTHLINAMNGVDSGIKAGNNVPYLSRDENGNVTTKSIFEGTQLNITSLIAQEKSTFHLYASSASIIRYSESGEPIVAISESNTSIQIASEKTIAISGLTYKRQTKDTHGIWGLRKIPFVGKRFFTWGKNTWKDLDVHMFITMTPQVAHDSDWKISKSN